MRGAGSGADAGGQGVGVLVEYPGEQGRVGGPPLRRGLQTLPADQRDEHATGAHPRLVVDDLEAELAHLQAECVAITMPLTAEAWGERAFQVRDPNGIIVQLVDWNAPSGG